MKILFLFGDSAVGKMSVGRELMELTGLRLFHNHMTIEPVLDIFGNFNAGLILDMRRLIFREFAKTDNYGMVFTFMWDFDEQSDWDYVAEVRDIFLKEKPDTEFYYAELVADLETRLERNHGESRLAAKPSKRDLAASDARLMAEAQKHRCVSRDGEIPFANYIKLDNTVLLAKGAAMLIRECFSL